MQTAYTPHLTATKHPADWLSLVGLASRALLLSLAILCIDAHALTIDEDRIYQLTPAMSWFEDDSDSITIRELIQDDSSVVFSPNRDASFNIGYRNAPVWFHVPLFRPKTKEAPQSFSTTPSISVDKTWLLSINYAQLDLIDIYTVKPDGRISHHRLGDSLPFDQRPYKYHQFVSPITIDEGENIDLYIRVKTQSSVQMPMTLSSPRLTTEQQGVFSTLYGMYFGIMLVMILYNLFIYITVRDKSYLFYVVYISCFALFQASLSGHAYAYFWPNFPQMAQLSTPVFIALTTVFGIQFSRSFLSVDKHFPNIDRLLIALCSLSTLIFILAFIAPYPIIIKAVIGCAVLSTLVVFMAGAISLKSGNPIARFFLLAWLGLLPGVIIQALANLNILPNNMFTAQAGMIGATLEVVLLSLALADRINVLRKENKHIAAASREKTQKINRELSVALSQVEQNNRLKDQFLGTISHEFRTPMNGVEGSLALIKTDNLSPGQKNYIRTAQQSAQEMTALVDSILRFSEIQSGALELKPEAINLRELFNPYEMSFRKHCLNKNLELSWHIDRSIPDVITGDSEQLLLVLHQLLDNAIKFTLEGHISINISSNREQSSHQEMLTISVIDSGEGIQTEQLDSVFNAFHQLNGEFNRSHRGLGIGLAICRELAKIMQGNLHVESTPGEGTEFVFSIPLHRGSEDAIYREEDISEAICSHKTILIAEDNPVNQMVLKGMLQQLGCVVITANNGEEVSRVLTTQPVDLIMMDCQMPVVDGFEATRKIRASRGAYSNIPIIAVTANAMTGDSQRCLKAGMNDYIKKPINRSIVERKVKRWLQNEK